MSTAETTPRDLCDEDFNDALNFAKTVFDMAAAFRHGKKNPHRRSADSA